MKTDLPIYDKIRELLIEEGFILSSEQGCPDIQMYLTAWTKDTRVQLNVRNKISPPIKLKNKFQEK